MSKRLSRILVAVVLIIAAVLYWCFLPPLSLFHFGTVLSLEIIGVIIFFLIRCANPDDWNILTKALISTGKIAMIITGVDLLILIICCPLFHGGMLYSQLGNGNIDNIKKVPYQQMIEEVDTSQLPVIDEESARVYAEAQIGGNSALGSAFKLGAGAKIDVGGIIYWIFPLEHAGFWEWKDYPSSPGYVAVNASNPSDAKIHDGYKIVYSKSSYLMWNTMRHVRFGYLFGGLTEYTYEVNDDWQPMEVITTYSNKVGWFYPEATGVIINDPQTGKRERYNIDEVPDWVDIVQPESFITDQIDNYGGYVRGSVHFGKADEKQKTEEMLTVYKGNDCYYFTGMTSKGGDKSLTGFMMVNTRTKEALEVDMDTGITETRAMEIGANLWSDFGYYSIEPLPINVDGVATFVVPVKSEISNTITGYSMVCAIDSSIAAKGETLRSAAKRYSRKLGSSNVGFAASDKAYNYEASGTIFRIHSEMQEVDTYYLFVLSDDMTKIYTCDSALSDELAMTETGDQVEITYVDDGNGTLTVKKFDNKLFELQISENQKRRDEANSSANDDIEIPTVDPEVNSDWWDNLTEEEKTDIMNQSSEEE